MKTFVRPKSYRGPYGNKRYTAQLFWDKQVILPVESRNTDICLFTLHHDVDGYVNFRKEYLKDRDPSGYKTATRLLENYDHWLLLMKASWFVGAKEIWDKELRAILESEANDVLALIMRGGDDIKISEQITAAKALKQVAAHIGKKETPQRKAGRPSNDEIEGALKESVREAEELDNALKRIKEVK